MRFAVLPEPVVRPGTGGRVAPRGSFPSGVPKVLSVFETGKL